jgi:phenylpyruvate tautomerase PptA (4-oxalocrotonate tautomerase family)
MERKMPLIQVYHPEGGLPADKRDKLGEHLTHVIIEIEGGAGADTPNARSIAWVMFHAVPNADWMIGGKTDDTYVSPPGKFLVRVFVPEGSLSRERKAMVHKAVDDAFYEVFSLGTPPEKRWPSIFVHIHEWGEGNLGGFGRSFGLLDVGGYAGKGNPEVCARSRAYIEARTAWRKSTGFPD